MIRITHIKLIWVNNSINYPYSIDMGKKMQKTVIGLWLCRKKEDLPL